MYTFMYFSINSDLERWSSVVTSIVTLTPKEFKGGSSRLVWPVAMSMGDCLDCRH